MVKQEESSKMPFKGPINEKFLHTVPRESNRSNQNTNLPKNPPSQSKTNSTDEIQNYKVT